MQDNSDNQVFEDVDTQTFLGEEASAMHRIVTKVANNNPTVTAGIESLLREDLVFRSFERAFALMITAKSEQHLQRAEAGYQVTINEIKQYHASNSRYLDHKKTSLYLFTLQYLILHLGKWKFPEKRVNNFKPTLLQKLHEARLRCAYAGIGYDVLRQACFSKDYQQPYDKNLRNFEFLDEQRLDTFLANLKRYDTTRTAHQLYKLKSLSRDNAPTQAENALEKIIRHVETTFGIKELNLHFYTRNFHAINEVIANFIGTNKLPVIYNVAETLRQYLESQEQFKTTLRGQDGHSL